MHRVQFLEPEADQYQYGEGEVDYGDYIDEIQDGTYEEITTPASFQPTVSKKKIYQPRVRFQQEVKVVSDENENTEKCDGYEVPVSTGYGRQDNDEMGVHYDEQYEEVDRGHCDEDTEENGYYETDNVYENVEQDEEEYFSEGEVDIPEALISRYREIGNVCFHKP